MSIRRSRQGGFALLVVLFVGAVMAIMMMVTLPRAALEAQRAREDDLIYRGSQYARAVQVFYRKFKRYPAKVEDLENFNNVRFLRRKYADPMTKGAEWRVVHMGPAGMFTDSLVYDKPKQKKEGETGSWSGPQSTGIADTVPGAGGTQTGGMADRLRGPVGGIPGAPQDPNAGQIPNTGQVPNPMYFNTGQPGAQPGAPGAVAYPGMAAPVAGVPTQPGAMPFGAQPQPGAPPGMVQMPPTGFVNPGMPGAQPGVFPGGAGSGPRPGFPTSYPPGATPGAPGAFGVQPGAPTQQPQQSLFGGTSLIGSPGAGSQAAALLGSLLTTARPGGLTGIQPGVATAGGMQVAGGIAGAPGFGGGFAGVASKLEARGIKVFRERENYNEWEFVYDYRLDPLLTGAMAAGIQQQPGMNPAGQNPASAFGQQPGVAPINPAQPGLSGSPFSPPGARGMGGTPIITPVSPPTR